MYLLQSSGDGFAYFLGALLGLFVTLLLCRWIFRIDTIVDNLRMQNRLLGKIAKHQGVDENEIREVLGLKKIKSTIHPEAKANI